MHLPALCAAPTGDLEHAANSVNYGCSIMTRTAEQTTMRKVYLRLLPFLHPVHVRVLPRPGQCRLRRADDEQGYWVQRLPFWAGRRRLYGGCCLFEVPSNLMLENVGARFWLARIMITRSR
jgi:MFS transporter, ACS family, tartrate transporter